MNLINQKIKIIDNMLSEIKDIFLKQENENKQTYIYHNLVKKDSDQVQNEEYFYNNLNEFEIKDNNRISISENLDIMDNRKSSSALDMKQNHKNDNVVKSNFLSLNNDIANKNTNFNDHVEIFQPKKLENTNKIKNNSKTELNIMKNILLSRRNSTNKNYRRKSQFVSQEQMSEDQIANFPEVSGQNWNINPTDIIFDDFDDLSFFINLKDQINYVKIKDIQIPHDSIFTLFWNCLITLILMFYIVVFPQERFSEIWIVNNKQQIFFNLVFEQFFIVDICINFFTSQRDSHGKIVGDTYQIIYKQLVSWFILDLFSSIPTNNLLQFNIIQTRINNSLLKALKIPKYLRIFRGFNNLYEVQFVSIKMNLFENMSNADFCRIINAVKFGLIFVQMSNVLVCLLVSFVQQCEPSENCHNWFQALIEEEYHANLYSSEYNNHIIALNFQELNPDEAAGMYQNYILRNHRNNVQMDAWQFVFQTVTTVGQGDITTFSTQERLFRSLCMIFGVIIQTILSAQVMDTIISDTLDIQRKNEHVVMIEKLQLKQAIQGESRRFLGMLGDSVYTEPIQKEIEFINMLPTQMCDTVLKQIWNVYYEKLNLLADEDISFFKELMKVAQFRRCIPNEIVGTEQNKLNIVQSGQVGVFVPNLNSYLNLEFLYQRGVGEEFGFQNLLMPESRSNFDYTCIISSGQVGVFVPNLNSYLNLEFLYQRGVGEEFGFQNLLMPESRSNFDYTCIISSEIIEINVKEQVELISKSLKGFEQLFNKIKDQMMNLQMVVSLYNAMIKMGLYIEQHWYKKIMTLMKFGTQDQDILYKIQKRLIKFDIDFVDEKLNKRKNNRVDWYDYQLDVESYKQILSKSKQAVELMLATDDQLINFKLQIKNKYRMHCTQSYQK